MGHELLFQRFGNKFSLESTETPGIDDLVKAVYICSQPYSREFSMDGFSISPRARLWKWIFGPEYLASALNQFRKYIKAHTEIPEYYLVGDPQERPVGSPTIQTVKVARLQNSTMTEDQILNAPFSLMFWDHLTWMEGQGLAQIIDDAERARQTERAELAKSLEATILALKAKLFPPPTKEEAFGA